MLISRNLILQGFLKSGSKSCKPEVTFAIHPVSRRLTERLSQIYIKKSNRKFSLRFEKEETGSEEKRLRE